MVMLIMRCIRCSNAMNELMSSDDGAAAAFFPHIIHLYIRFLLLFHVVCLLLPIPNV